MRFLARTVRGTEWIAAAEIDALPVSDIRLAQREIRFSAADAEVLDLRTVDDLFLLVADLDGVGHTKDILPVLASRVASLDWAGSLTGLRSLRSLPSEPAFDVVASFVGRRNFNRFACEDALGAALSSRLGGRFVSRSGADGPSSPVDLTVRVFLDGTQATIAVRVAAAPLHRRLYKNRAERGTLHPPLAAALGLLLGPVTVVADPFCGDATIAVELLRRDPGVQMLASDLDPARVANAVANAADSSTTPLLVRADAGALPWRSHTVDAVATNPPWNLAVDATGLLRHGLDPFWPELRRVLTGAGRLAIVADEAMSLPKTLLAQGYSCPLAQQIRLAGRVSDLILAGPAGTRLPADLARWRDRALAASIMTGTGF